MSSTVVDRLNAALEGQYRVEREIGRGGMAVVYLAQDLKHGRPVAIKVLDTALGETMGEERFAREIETAARLNHPNILALLDSGKADGLRYFVMPFVEGESLRNVLDREGTLEVERVVTYAREIGSALSYAHEQGLVHRDIKPENILFQAGHAVVCDFGIAKAMTEASVDSLTRTGTSVGTFAYMSPEQLSDGAEIDHRTDVYSLGCVVYEMLEGEPPFAASTPQAAMAKKLVGDLPERSTRGDVPDSVWDVLRKAMASDPEGRFPTTDGFVLAVGHATTEVAVARSRRRRSMGRLLRGVGAVTAAAALIATGMWLSDRIGGPTYERLAVMPLANTAGDAREDFYVQGFQEDLVEEMQRAGLRVLNPSATRVLSQQGRSTAEIADELDLDALVEGSVERVGPRVGVEIRLIDGATQELVWSGTFSGAQSDVVTLLHQITLEIAERTGAELSAENRAILTTASEIDAVLYELLLQGRYEAFKLTRESLDEAERYFQRAIDRDSMSADAWVGLAETWNLRGQEGFISGDSAAIGREAILDGAPIDHVDRRMEALSETWSRWREARWDEAEEHFLAWLEERPADQATRAYYALLLLYLGKDEQAEREITRAVTLAPYDPLVLTLQAQYLNAQHRYREAESALLRAREMEGAPGFLDSTLRTTYHLLGEDSLAIESTRAFYRARGDSAAIQALDGGYRSGGYEAALEAVADHFVARRDAGEAVSEWQIGTLYTRAGLHDEAIEYLGYGMDEGSPNSPYLSIDPIFDPMRDDPRFQALVDRLRLPPRTEGPG